MASVAPAAPPQSRKAQQSDQTREALLSTCLHLFAQRGFSSTSIDDIARAAGVTKGAIYWHFTSKETIFDAILERIRDRWTELVHGPVSRAKDPQQQVAQLFDAYAELFGHSPDMCFFLQQVILDRQHAQFANQVAKVFAATARFIAGIIERGKTSGVIRRDLDANTTAHLILGMLAGASQQASTSRTRSLKALIAEAKVMTMAHIAKRRAPGTGTSRNQRATSRSRTRGQARR
jgi:AcrR family transcriptional regulator